MNKLNVKMHATCGYLFQYGWSPELYKGVFRRASRKARGICIEMSLYDVGLRSYASEYNQSFDFHHLS